MIPYTKNTLVRDKFSGTIYLIVGSRYNQLNGEMRIVYVCIEPHAPVLKHYKFHAQLEILEDGEE